MVDRSHKVQRKTPKNLPKVCPSFGESTALGAAIAAGLASGVFRDLDHVRSLAADSQVFSPKISKEEQRHRLSRFSQAVERSFDWTKQ